MVVIPVLVDTAPEAAHTGVAVDTDIAAHLPDRFEVVEAVVDILVGRVNRAVALLGTVDIAAGRANKVLAPVDKEGRAAGIAMAVAGLLPGILDQVNLA